MWFPIAHCCGGRISQKYCHHIGLQNVISTQLRLHVGLIPCNFHLPKTTSLVGEPQGALDLGAGILISKIGIIHLNFLFYCSYSLAEDGAEGKTVAFLLILNHKYYSGSWLIILLIQVVLKFKILLAVFNNKFYKKICAATFWFWLLALRSVRRAQAFACLSIAEFYLLLQAGCQGLAKQWKENETSRKHPGSGDQRQVCIG